MTMIDPEPKPDAEPAEESAFGDAFAARAAGEEVEAEDPSPEGDKPADAEQASEEAAPAASPNGSTFDPFAGMSPEQKAHWQRLQHSEQSQRGRVAALTKKMQSQPAQHAPAASAADGDDDKGKDANAADLEAKLKAAADEYPDAVGPLVEVIADIRKQIEGISSTVAPISEAQDEAAMTEAFKQLEKAHPDYREIANDPNWEAWVADQPANIQALAESFDPREVSLTITLFKTERQAEVSPGNGQNDPTPNATEEKRKRQLDGGKDVPSKGIPAAGGVPNDFGAAFKARAQKQG